MSTPKAPKSRVEFDQAAAIARISEALFIRTMLSPAANTKTLDYHAKKALAIATAFAETVNADGFTKTAAERFAELT
jgi:hypothetical protein